MITQDKIDEWLREVEERPSSAPIILQYITKRLRQLSEWNEELRAENLELRSSRKVEEYEKQIAKLMYQVELLKRQVGAGAIAVQPETLSVLAYNWKGEVLRFELDASQLSSNSLVARLAGETSLDSRIKLLVTGSHEELLFVFTSGRTTAMAAAEIPAVDGGAGDWSGAFLQEPRGAEDLAVIAPIGRMPLIESCVQTSLRGCVKRIPKQYFEAHIANNFIGSGVKQTPDKTCDLVLCAKEDQFFLATREGFLLTLAPDRLPYSIEEALHLAATDYVVNTFVTAGKPALVVMTQSGKIIHREIGWVEPASTFKTHGQPVFSPSRRKAGVRVAGAAAVDEQDWAVTLDNQGQMTLYRMGDILAAGAVTTGELETEILWFSTFTMLAREETG